MGAELVFFSPLHDKKLPAQLDGLCFMGVSELFAKELSENLSMREEIRRSLSGGMACMAECGGFMYLHREMEDMEKISIPWWGQWTEKPTTEKLGPLDILPCIRERLRHMSSLF